MAGWIKFEKLDSIYLKFNRRIMVVGLLLIFVIVGFSFVFLAVQRDYESMKEEMVEDNEILSNAFMLDFLLIENFLENSENFLQFVHPTELFDNESSVMEVFQSEDRWNATMYDYNGAPIYIRGNGNFDEVYDEINSELNSITFFFKESDTPGINGAYYFNSIKYDFEVLYSSGNTVEKLIENEGLINRYFDRFNYDIKYHSYSTKIRDNGIYFWSTSKIDEESYLSVCFESLSTSMDYAEMPMDSIYLESSYDDMTVYNNGGIEVPDDSNLVPYGKEVFVENVDNTYFVYRYLSSDIVYVSGTSQMKLIEKAVGMNISIIMIVIMSFVMLILVILYSYRYQNLLELENEFNEQEMMKSLYKSRLGYVMNTIAEAFVRADSDYCITEVNQAAADMFGYRVEELLGQFIGDFVVNGESIDINGLSGLNNRYEIELRKKDNSRFYGLINQSTIIRDNGDMKEHYIMVTDITPMIEAQQKAEEANKSKSRFIANLSHEIRTPMNATIGYIYLLEQTKLTSVQKSYLEKMDYASKTLIEIIDDILDFSKIEADSVVLENVSFDLKEMFEKATVLFENILLEKNIGFNLEMDERIPDHVIGDPHHIKQILVNLLSNAFKFTSEGMISVKVERIKKYESEEGSQEIIIRVLVEDTGIGIPKEKMKQLFDPFVQADESTTRIYGGTGLGLSISKKLVELMNGKIYATSVLNEGSTFIFEIPLKVLGNMIMEEGKIKNALFRGSKKHLKVLVVEDNKLNQELLLELLQSYDFKVVIANNGKLAEDILFSDHKKEFDLILMDIQMPIQDGYETTDNIRHSGRYKDVPIIAVTANADKRTQNNIKKVGMNDYLLKPINTLALKEKIDKWR